MTINKKILIVDDDDATRFLCTEALILAGYTVESTVNGKEALTKLRDSAYDLVISDIEMPELDGITLYQRILKNHPHLKNRFFFITGNASRENLSALSSLKRRYLVKPFKISDLVEMVNKVRA